MAGLKPLFEPPSKPARRRKRRASSNRYRFTRLLKGSAWQARVWLSPRDGSLNLGLFTKADHPSDPGRPDDEMAEWAAGRASAEFVRHYRPHQPGHGLRETLDHLKAKGYIPQKVLPPRVEREGEGYLGRVKKKGRVYETAVFADPWDAYSAMRDLLEREFPPKPNRLEELRRAQEEKEQGLKQFVDLADFFSTRSTSPPAIPRTSHGTSLMV